MRVATLALITTLMLAASPRVYAATPQHIAPEGVHSYLSIADEHEPGEWVVIEGIVSDGNTWLRDASIYVSHADWTGHDSINQFGEPRLNGFMRSNYYGGYDFDTVRPGHPDLRTPAHINCVVTARGFKDRVIEIYFDDDILLTPDLRAAAEKPPEDDKKQVVILPLRRDGRGVFHTKLNILLKRI